MHPMSYTVAKPFKSINRKFAAGDKIAPSDIVAGHHFTFRDWVARGFITADDAAQAKPASSVRPSSRAVGSSGD